MDYEKEIQILEDKVYKNMGQCSQLVIDLIQNFSIEFFDREDTEPVERDEVGAKSYQVGLILEIIDPTRKFDMQILKEFDVILEKWQEEIEFINKALGIPLHKG